MLKYHALALMIGMILDICIGDPHGIWHPIVVIGKLISWLDTKLLGDKNVKQPCENVSPANQRRRGRMLVVIVVMSTALATALITFTSYIVSPYLGIIIEAILSCYCLAGKSLIVESRAVVIAYKKNGIEAARKALSMIVGRDTTKLELPEIVRATVETVAENASDGVVAPFLYLFIGGPVLGLVYKAINTMDSMVGYHNERYEDFGRAAAHLDDVVNFVPSRITGLLTVLSACICGKDYDAKNAYCIFKRDRFNHKSPNSAQSEAAFAGALGLELGGNSYYFGKLVEKPTIGDPLRKIEIEDVARSHRLLMGIISIGFVVMLIMVGIIKEIYL